MSNVSNSIDLPIDTAELLLARKDANRANSVSVNKDGKLLSNGNKDAEYKITLRKIERAEDREPSERAMKLKACKGLKGCEFAECVENAFGKLPKHLEKLCSTKYPDADM